MRKHGGVTHQLVNDVRLRRVQRLCVVPNVLCRVEHFKGQSVKELALGQQSSDRLQSPASPRLEEG